MVVGQVEQRKNEKTLHPAPYSPVRHPAQLLFWWAESTVELRTHPALYTAQRCGYFRRSTDVCLICGAENEGRR